MDRRVPREAGVVDQDVQLAGRGGLGGAADQARHEGRGEEVAGEGDGGVGAVLGVEVGGQRGELRGVDVGEEDGRTFGGEEVRG